MPKPKLDLDEKEIRRLAYDMASQREIAALLGCDEEVIRRRFKKVVEQEKARRRTDIRRKQFTCAGKGSAAMLIWLGKQYLDQVDRPEGSDEPRKIVVEYLDRPIDPAAQDAAGDPE